MIARLAWLTHLDNPAISSVVTATTTNSAYPLVNLRSLPISAVWRSTSVADHILAVDMVSVKTVDAMAIVNHNLSSAATVRIRGGSSASIAGGYSTEILVDTPTAYYRFDEPSGTSITDYSGNTLTGVYNNTPTLGITGALAGDSNTAVRFDQASNEYGTVADAALLDLGTNTFSISGWVKLAALPFGGLFGYIVSKGTTGYGLFVDDAGHLGLSKIGTATIVLSTTTMAVGTWYHFAATKSGATSKLYINGVDRTGAVSDQTIAATSGNLQIGREAAATNNIDASFDELALFSTALSAVRVLAQYTAGVTGSTLLPWRSDLMFSLAAVAQSYRYWTITISDAANTDGYFEIGYLMLGPSTKPTFNFRQGWKTANEFVNSEVTTEFGTTYVEPLFRRQNISLQFGPISPVEMAVLRTLNTTSQRNVYPFLLVPEGDGTEAYFGRIQNLLEETVSGPWRYGNLDFREDSFGTRIGA